MRESKFNAIFFENKKMKLRKKKKEKKCFEEFLNRKIYYESFYFEGVWDKSFSCAIKIQEKPFMR